MTEVEAFARSFNQIETPIAQLKSAARTAAKAVAIDASSEEARRAVRQVARAADKLEKLWLLLHNASCGAGRSA